MNIKFIWNIAVFRFLGFFLIRKNNPAIISKISLCFKWIYCSTLQKKTICIIGCSHTCLFSFVVITVGDLFLVESNFLESPILSFMFYLENKGWTNIFVSFLKQLFSATCSYFQIDQNIFKNIFGKIRKYEILNMLIKA